MVRLLALVFLAGCAHAPPIVFSYDGADGPAHWGGACMNGKTQSPIDLHGAARGLVPKLVMEYWPTRMHVVHNGHTIELPLDPGSFLSVDGRRYALTNLHFHQPSEHVVDGKNWAMELHLVHKSDNGKLAVVAIPIVAGASNRWLEPAWVDLPNAGERHDLDAKINAADLLPASHLFVHYRGSLTIPPCTEGVEWFVFSSPIEMSAEQIAKFVERVGDNHRPVQPLLGRSLVEGDIK